MAFATSERVAQALVWVLDERMPKWCEAVPGLRDLPRVKAWRTFEWGAPVARGDCPKGIIGLERRESERAEQDSGDYGTFRFLARVYTGHEEGQKGAKRWALRYGTAVALTIGKEGHGKRPKDQSTVPGWFRAWAEVVGAGTDTKGLWAVDVRVVVQVDQSVAYAQ